MNKKQLNKCYEYLSKLFELTNNKEDMEAIITIKDLIITRIKYRESFEIAFKNHNPTTSGDK
jgi:flagellin-specific chaperone FliS